VFGKHFPNVSMHGDVNTLDLGKVGPQDRPLSVVVVTTPCTDVSARGNHMGVDGEETPLFMKAMDAVEKYIRKFKDTYAKPTIVFENVCGIRFRWKGAVTVCSLVLDPSCLHALCTGL